MTDSFNLPATTSEIPAEVPATAGSTPIPEPSPAPSTPKTSINVHPKVFTALLIGLGITVVSALATYFTPDTLAFLGPWEAPALALVTTGLSLLGAWLKKVKDTES